MHLAPGAAWRDSASDSFYAPFKLKLHKMPGVLFLPEQNERRFQPRPQRGQPVCARVAGGAKGYQEPGVVHTRSAVMNA